MTDERDVEHVRAAIQNAREALVHMCNVETLAGLHIQHHAVDELYNAIDYMKTLERHLAGDE